MYLRKMGRSRSSRARARSRSPSASRKGEQKVNSAILDSPIAVREIIDLGEKLKKHKIRVKDLIKDAEETDEGQEFDEEEADRRIIRLIDKVKRLDKKKRGPPR
jgi:RNA polymerase primary sigma factor